jgi:transposase, IS5 family
VLRFSSNEAEHGQAEAALAHHQRLLGHPPRLLAGDRGVRSPTTQRTLEEAGVKTVAIPAVGKVSAQQQAVERSRSFRRAFRWRAGIEGRINSLRRDYGLRRCAYHGMPGLQRWLGWGIVASNLHHVAQAKAVRSTHQQAAKISAGTRITPAMKKYIARLYTSPSQAVSAFLPTN